MRRTCSLRRGVLVRRGNANPTASPVGHGNTSTVHLRDSIAKIQRTTIRSNYNAEIDEASHEVVAAYPTAISLIELNGELTKLHDPTKTIDSEILLASLSHLPWKREKLAKDIIKITQSAY